MNKIDMQNTFLSKSQFIRGLQCHKSLYLHRHHPELRDEVSSAQQELFQSGQNVGEFARELFPEGVIIQYEDVPLNLNRLRIQRLLFREMLILYMKQPFVMTAYSSRQIFYIAVDTAGSFTK